MSTFALRDFSLDAWQDDAVDAWAKTERGTLEIFTGGGKTLIALACIARAAAREPALRVAIAVPTIGLALQWRESIVRYSTAPQESIGMLGGGHHDTLAAFPIVIAVLNSAAKHFPAQARGVGPVMLVVDECHRAGAPTFSKVLQTPSVARLGLSATPYRDEVGENGEPIAWDRQVLGRELGAIVYSFTLRDARRIGWLPDYAIAHHGVELDPDERNRYRQAGNAVDSAETRLKEVGGDAGRAWGLQRRGDALGDAARSYVVTVTKRKEIVYGARERKRVALALVRERLVSTPDSRILIFNERVDAAVALADELRAAFPDVAIALEHSSLADTERQGALDAFRSGDARVLVSVRALTEGIDVPGADVGISVASSASVRQRVQLLGRVLRRTFDGSEKSAVTHLLYAADTVDTLIYAREDWSDLTGDASNRYFRWPLDADAPIPQDGPPARPSPTEAQEHERLGDLYDVAQPQVWLGLGRGAEYSMNAAGVVTNALGRAVRNPQTVGAALRSVRGRPDGRFRITPQHRYVVVWDAATARNLVAGQIRDPFVIEAEAERSEDFDVTRLRPGDPYMGPRTTELADARISATGTIKRKRRGGGRDIAESDGADAPHANARAVVAAWRSLRLPSIAIGVNAAGHVWWRDPSGVRFLGVAPGGFAWPARAQGE
jgi:superfamily II DNA or RNA helicase